MVSADRLIGVGVARRLGAVVLVVGTLLALAAPASAATRLASPTGGGASPCNPTPCSLLVAAGGAKDGDQVVLAPGTYTMPIELTIDKAVDVGASPGSLATIDLQGAPLHVVNAGATVHDLRLLMTADTMSGPLVVSAGTVERVVSGGGEFGGAGCVLEGGLLRDSVCLDLMIAQADAPGVTVKVVNVTAESLIVGTNGVGSSMDLAVLNSIFVPRGTQGSDPNAVTMDVFTGGSATVAMRNSSYNSVDSIGLSSNYTITPPGTNGNQTAPPLFVDRAHGDFREAPGSPTIDAGLADPLVGAMDVLGTPRMVPPCGAALVPDMGAYEFRLPAACGPPERHDDSGAPPAPAATPSNKLGFGKLSRDLRKGTATLAVAVPGPGTVVLAGKWVVGRQLTARKAEMLKLLVKAKGKQARELARLGKVKLRPTVTFLPLGGSVATQVRPLTLKLAPPSS